MKNLTVLSIITASLLLVGCGDSATGAEAKAAEHKTEAHESVDKVATAKDAVAHAAEKVKEAAAEKTTEAVAAAKESATAAVDSAKEAANSAVDSAKEAATSAVDTAKEAAASAATAATAAVAGPDGKALFAKCAGCHGADGKTKALGKSEVLSGQSAADLETKIAGYKAGTLDVAGMGGLMKGQVASYSDDDIKAVAAYISGL